MHYLHYFTFFIYHSNFSSIHVRANMIPIEQHSVRNTVQMPNTILVDKHRNKHSYDKKKLVT